MAKIPVDYLPPEELRPKRVYPLEEFRNIPQKFNSTEILVDQNVAKYGDNSQLLVKGGCYTWDPKLKATHLNLIRRRGEKTNPDGTPALLIATDFESATNFADSKNSAPSAGEAYVNAHTTPGFRNSGHAASASGANPVPSTPRGFRRLQRQKDRDRDAS